MMKTRNTGNKGLAIVLAGLLSVFSAAAHAQTPLPQEKHINMSLMAGVIGDEIRKNCPSISPRYLVVWQKLEALKTYAIKKGYKRDEVKKFLKDPVQKARVKKLAADYMAAHGVKPGDPESYCKLGEEEIARKSLIGQMLRAR